MRRGVGIGAINKKQLEKVPRHSYLNYKNLLPF